MKNLEKILLVIAAVALAMKFFFIPGNGFLLILSITIVALIYYPLGFAFFNGIRLRHIFKKASYSNAPTRRIIGAVGAGMVLSVLAMGILFDFQDYPGASIQQLTGMMFGLIVLTRSLIKYTGAHDLYYKRIIIRLTVAIVIALPLYLIPEIELVKLQYRNHPDYIEAYERYSQDLYNDSLRVLMENEGSRAFNKEMGFPEDIEGYK